ncbi:MULTISPECIES: hypothetical protein [Arenibacter]|jgi:hypothetical protein|uniref:hypothetical protein n=1 Tax=Arenibacter TaxID=178469 RepID=UPI0012FFF6EE|nr:MULTISPECIES: hypothetical protein [Arenibacter]
MQKVLLSDFKKSIKGNQKIFELKFDKDEKLELVQKRRLEINTDSDEKYDTDPEEIE